MIINSEQEMLDFGTKFAESLIDNSPWMGDTPGGGSPLSTSEVGEEKVWQDPSRKRVIELIGDVGAGKTTFVRGFAKGLGVKEPITSPSFTISKSYALPHNEGHLIHYDFYRLQDPGLMSEDLQENLSDSTNIVVIEWGDSVSDLLPADHIVIKIEYNNDNTRSINLDV